jgi:hypothetical protein
VLGATECRGTDCFVAGVPEIVASLHEAHSLSSSSIDTAISDVFSKRAPLRIRPHRRLEDAYAVSSTGDRIQTTH